MRKFALLTSGGDAPGMNAAIRSVTRSLLFYENEVIGIRRGYEGLLDEDFLPMSRSSVGGILLHGGTILKTARSPQFMCEEGINKAVENLKKYDIDGLVVIGGDGTFRGAEELHNRGVSV
ncbi:MAG: 6-phosphofructokinase, partial [Clostridia bacterium]